MGYLWQGETHGSGTSFFPSGWPNCSLGVQRLKENAKHLTLRPENFERVLEEIGFGPAEHLGATGEGGKSNERCCTPLLSSSI